MLTVAVTGGIGSGKSTVSRLLGGLGAVVVDSDLLAREAVAPGTPGLAEVSDAFGPGVLSADGSLDRAALAAIVFRDEAARHRLEAITHPRVRAAFRAVRDAAGAGAIVVNDIPLVRTVADAAQFHLVVTVAARHDTRMRRLLDRGLAENDARARMRAQIPDEARRPLSDVWLDNDGDEADLRRTVEALWTSRLVPFQDNLLAGRPARFAVPAGSAPAEPSPVLLLCARVTAATGGLPCSAHPSGGTVPSLRVAVPDLLTADALAPALARAGFPRAHGGDGADAPEPGAGARLHAAADPGCPVTVHLTSTSPSTSG